MLPKDKRLNLSLEFKEVVSGKRVETPTFTIYIKQAQVETTKIGIALTKKNFASAVLRNRARRLTSKVFEDVYPSLIKNLKVVIMPKTLILERKVEDLKQEVLGVSQLYATSS